MSLINDEKLFLLSVGMFHPTCTSILDKLVIAILEAL